MGISDGQTYILLPTGWGGSGGGEHPVRREAGPLPLHYLPVCGPGPVCLYPDGVFTHSAIQGTGDHALHPLKQVRQAWWVCRMKKEFIQSR